MASIAELNSTLDALENTAAAVQTDVAALLAKEPPAPDLTAQVDRLSAVQQALQGVADSLKSQEG